MENVKNQTKMTNEDFNKEKSNDYCSDVIKKLKENVKTISENLDKTRDYNQYIAGLKAIEKSMEIIHEFDWQPQFSKYRVNNKEDSGIHYEVSTWEQNSDNEIRNHKRYELKTPENLNNSERHGVSCVNGKEYIMTNEEMDEFENRFDKEMNSVKNMFRDNFRIIENINKYFESCFVPSKLFENK